MAHTAVPSRRSVAAAGVVSLAVLFLVIAVLCAAEGVAALRNDPYPASPPYYSYRMTPAIWGWVHISYCIVLATVGISLIVGAAWARTAAVVIAAATIVANFLWLPHSPAWAGVIILVCAVAIWAVATWRPAER
ncbi:DUF7144 family membrane protein [Nocardia fusca]|uniref:DUF7144 domain-containing protein n=1 Tax=Nocardia fusca TaxID=941183 RepID=A0ABV3F4E6_9NOCA